MVSRGVAHDSDGDELGDGLRAPVCARVARRNSKTPNRKHTRETRMLPCCAVRFSSTPRRRSRFENSGERAAGSFCQYPKCATLPKPLQSPTPRPATTRSHMRLARCKPAPLARHPPFHKHRRPRAAFPRLRLATCAPRKKPTPGGRAWGGKHIQRGARGHSPPHTSIMTPQPSPIRFHSPSAPPPPFLRTQSKMRRGAAGKKAKKPVSRRSRSRRSARRSTFFDTDHPARSTTVSSRPPCAPSASRSRRRSSAR